MLEAIEVSCPYCGERFTSSVDISAGNQQYIEDCYVCCRPISFVVVIDDKGGIVVETQREDE